MIDISVRDLTKAFEVNKNILDGLTFQVQHGERVGILGRNGTGKTTLFRLMVGELTEDSQKTMEEEVQKLTDKYIKNIDAAVEEKQKEIMSV